MCALISRMWIACLVVCVAGCATARSAQESRTPLHGQNTSTLSWRLDESDREIQFEGFVVDTEPHPRLPLALVYLAPEPGNGRISATDAVLVDLKSARWRTLGSGPAPVGWPNSVWSPDGRVLVTLEDRFGPFITLHAHSAKRWIDGDDKLAQRFAAHDYEAHRNHPAKVHRFERWVSAHAFQFSGTCCGDPIRYVADLLSSQVRLSQLSKPD